MAKGKLRSGLIFSTISAALKSKLCYFLLLSVVSTAVAVLNNYLIILIAPLTFAVVFVKPLLFEILLVDHAMEASIGFFDWYSCVDDNLYLGALPLENQDLDRLPNQLGIKAIVSIVQRFELETNTLAGRPVSPQQWRERGVQQLVLESPDFFPPPFECLDAGADFLNQQLIQGHKCYCHCKSGKGRSPCIIMAYFMKYKGDDAITAHARLKIARPCVFSSKSSQMRTMVAYGEYLRSPNKRTNLASK
jgi:atypical dual specificity phosphatase